MRACVVWKVQGGVKMAIDPDKEPTATYSDRRKTKRITEKVVEECAE